jgi:catechol 2,3-dioxygenase-like lactoylglutathione lyase family enzyme
MLMADQALGYLGISTQDIDEWSDFATRQLGLQLVDREVSRRALRVEDRRQRVVADKERLDAERFFGWDRPRLADAPITPARFLAFHRSAGRYVQ